MTGFDSDVINAHKPNPVHDIQIRRNDNGTRQIIIKNLPFNFTDEFGSDLTEADAQNIVRQMSIGNKTYLEMCQVMAAFNNRRYGPTSEE